MGLALRTMILPMLVVFFFNHPDASGQNVAPPRSERRSESAAARLVAATPLHCQDSFGNELLQVNFQVAVSNETDEVMLLLRHPQILYLYAATSKAELLRGSYGFRMTVTDITAGPPVPLDPNPEPMFVGVQPKHSIEASFSVRIPLSRARGHVQLGSISLPGRIWCRLQLSMWPHVAASPEAIAPAWSRFGRLWAKDIITEPSELLIQTRPDPRSCTSQR